VLARLAHPENGTPGTPVMWLGMPVPIPKGAWACLGVPVKFWNFTGRAMPCHRAWGVRHGARPWGMIFIWVTHEIVFWGRIFYWAMYGNLFQDIVTKKRNRLSGKTISNIMQYKRWRARHGEHITIVDSEEIPEEYNEDNSDVESEFEERNMERWMDGEEGIGTNSTWII
jgi:hypothetical protein